MNFNLKQVKIFYFSQFIWDRNNKALAFGEIIGSLTLYIQLLNEKKMRWGQRIIPYDVKIVHA
jgi:hypothetical protein